MEDNEGISPSVAALTAMQEMTSATIQNSQHPEGTAIKFRKTLNDLVLTIFSQPTAEKDGIIKLLACISHCMEEFPQIFVFKPRRADGEEPGLGDANKKAVSQAFTRWLISRLFQLLVWEGTEDVNEPCIALVVSLWKLMELRDLTAFLGLTSELVAFATNLVEAHIKLRMGRAAADGPIEICCFFEAGTDERDAIKKATLNLRNGGVKLEKLSECEHLQAQTTHVVEGIVGAITQYAARLIPALWTIFCHNVETGGFPLKQTALEAAVILNEHGGPPKNPQIQRYLLDCITALLDRIYSPQAVPSNRDAIERSVASILPDVIRESRDVFDRRRTAAELVDLVSRTKSAVLQKAIGSCICHFVRECDAGDQWLTSLPKLLGSLEESEWLAESFHGMIKLEIRNAAAPSTAEGIKRPTTVEMTPTWKLLSNQWLAYAELPPTQESVLCQLQSACELFSLGLRISQEGHEFGSYEAVLTMFRFPPELPTSIPDWSKKNFAKLYRSIVLYVKRLLNLRAWRSLPENSKSLLVGFLSLPWLSDASSTLDLPSSCLDANTNFASLSLTALGPEDEAAAMPLLAALPYEVGPHWRMYLFNKQLSSNVPRLQVAAVRSLGTLLHVLGGDSLESFEETIRNLIENGAPEVIEELAARCGQLVCVLSGGSDLLWCSGKAEENAFEIELSCANAKTSLRSTNAALFFDHLWSFLFSFPNSAVRLAMTLQLNHALGHVGKHGRLLDLCIALVEDGNYDVRRAFSKCMPAYLEALKSSGGSFENLVTHIKQTYKVAQGIANWRLLETILLTIGSIGKVADGELLSIVIITLLENLLSRVSLISATACSQIKEVAAAKRIEPNVLFMNYRRPISAFLVETLHEAQGRGDAAPLEILNNVVLVFNFADSKSVLTVLMPYFLPHLAIKASPQATALSRSLAKHLQISKRELFTKHFKNIFCHLVCFCSTAERDKALVYVQKETDVNIGSLLRLDCQRIHNELLLRIGSHYEQVFKGLAVLAAKDDCRSGSVAIAQPEEMAEFLQPRFLGFLAFFDHQIQNPKISAEEKQSAVESLISIIELMGSRHITAVRIKVLTTLRIILRFEDPALLNVCCRAWDTFVRTLGPSVLGPMLSQIVVTLLPVAKACPEGVLRIFEYLIIENKDALQTFFNDLYFVPDVPELASVNAVLKEHQERPSSAKDDTRAFLSRALRGVGHENLDVRLHAFSNLKSVIAAHRESMQRLILGSELVDPLVTQLVDTLLTGCRDSDSRARNLLGHCLGELGAIDPGRLDMKNCGSNDDQIKVYLSIDEDSFAVDLVCELARGVLGAIDTRPQDCSSFAIQEILQIYNCESTKDTSSPGGRLWNSFPEHVQETIAPLLHSRYIANKVDWTDIPQPIYCSSRGQTFHDWIKNFAGYLTSRVCQPKASQVFSACSMAIRHDANIALFLLPHTLVYVLQADNEEDTEMTFQEILAVLKHSGGKLPLQSDLNHMSVQAVFSVLDYLRKWVGKQFAGQMQSSLLPGCTNTEVGRVQAFLDKIPQDILASTSYKAQAHTRALMNLEAYIKHNPDAFQEQLGFLQKLYLALDEPDGIAGVNTVRQETSLRDQILSHEASGQPQDALSCYERAIQVDPEDPSLHQGLLRCLMDLDQPHTALTYANGVLAQRQTWLADINHYRVEAAWKLTSWDVLDTYLNCTESSVNTWGLGIGKALSAINSRNKDSFVEQLEILRNEQMAPLSAASMENGSYQRGYQHILKLHMLDELEKATETFLCPNASPRGVEDLLTQWGNRRLFVQSSMRCQEPMINLRRILLSIAAVRMPDLSRQLEQEIGRCWLYSAKIARKCGHLQRAYSSLLTATNYNLTGACLEQSKWHWQKGEQEQAILCLQKLIKEHYPAVVELKRSGQLASPSERGASYRCTWAKTKLMLARYTEESSNLESLSIIEMYRDVLTINPEWEDGHFFMAQFYDRILCSGGERKEKRGDMLFAIVKHFGTSLVHGCRYVYQSMPRLLSLWLEFGTTVAEAEKLQRNSTSKAIYESLLRTLSTLHTKLILPFSEQLPPYLFLTAFSQLISRICHSQPDVFLTLKKIIARLLVTYPQQSMWLMMAVSKSSYQIRKKRCEEIFAKAQEMSSHLYKFLSDATKLTDKFLELSNKQVPTSVSAISISKEFRGLLLLLQDRNFSRIIIPRQSNLMVALPTAGQGSHLKHEPFVHSQVFICGVKDAVELMSSLQRPKKFSLRGTDGKYYEMLCKPKDDLRKDCRLMEFNSVVNKFLLKDAESRRRQLHIRTYAVVPLNEECGLLEWVPNLSGLRIILNKIYKERKQYTDGNYLKKNMPPRHSSIEHKIDVFKTKMLPKYPPVFSEWFVRSFPDPTTWYLARLAYARTTAVMSMIGYILGLGDRHGENILYDSSCGDTVHVDFNCLFNRGETFEWPEVVPFRLTHNMIEAMGPLGYEGIYRKSCEVTLRVMRKQIDTLMSLLKPFIHDPLLEWRHAKSAGSSRGPSDQGEISNEKAMVHVQDIELRLKGVLKSKVANTKAHSLPLSIEGQVNHLIQEATDIKNLSQMYVGWAAYM